MLRSPRLPILAAVLLAAPVGAQSFNLDVGANVGHPLPSSAYGAAASQPGTWCSVPTSAQSAVALVDVTGAATLVTITPTGGFGDFEVDNVQWSGDDDRLMEDAADIGNAVQGFPGGSIDWLVQGLAAGEYTVYTYALAPDLPGIYTTEVDVAGATEGPQIVGGLWIGSPHVLGSSYALHTVTVAVGASLAITTVTPPPASNLGSVNGFQIVREPTGVAFCAGDGTLATACPCANTGVAGRGCNNSVASGGALLAANGTTAPDAVVLTSSFELAGALTIFLQGNATIASGVSFGDGVRCVGGLLKRIATKNAVGGVATYPQAGDPAIRAQSAALGDVIAPGSTRWYQAYYRDPSAAFCPPPQGDGWNASNGVAIVWP